MRPITAAGTWLYNSMIVVCMEEGGAVILQMLHQLHSLCRMVAVQSKQRNCAWLAKNELWCTGAGKVIEEDFEVGTAISTEKQLAPFPMQFRCSFCHDSETLLGESRRSDEASTSFTWPRVSQLFFFSALKWKPPSKEEDFRTSRTRRRI
jgi:hypothetical protein